MSRFDALEKLDRLLFRSRWLGEQRPVQRVSMWMPCQPNFLSQCQDKVWRSSTRFLQAPPLVEQEIEMRRASVIWFIWHLRPRVSRKCRDPALALCSLWAIATMRVTDEDLPFDMIPVGLFGCLWQCVTLLCFWTCNAASKDAIYFRWPVMANR